MTEESPRIAATFQTDGHLVQLDGLRGAAILMVMMYHFVLPHVDSHSSHANLLLLGAQAGWMGVDLFFVLSGFLITGILIDTRNSQNYFRNFLVRRFLRIWPLYYLTLIVLLVLLPLVLPAVPAELQSMRHQQGWFWLYGANWLFALEGGFNTTSGGYFWSLAVEEQFYLIWPLVVYLASNRVVLYASAFLLAGSFILRILLIRNGVSPASLYAMTVTHLDGLAVGSIIAVCLRNAGSLVRVWSAVPLLMVGSTLGLILVRVADRDFYYWSRNMATYGYTLVAVLFGAVLLLCLRQQRDTIITRLLSSRFLTKSGKYSYALYLVHVPIAALFYPAITRLAVRTVTGLGYQMIFVVYFVASFAVSWLIAAVSWHVFEKRILALKRYFIYRPRGAEQLSAVTQN